MSSLTVVAVRCNFSWRTGTNSSLHTPACRALETGTTPSPGSPLTAIPPVPMIVCRWMQRLKGMHANA